MVPRPDHHDPPLPVKNRVKDLRTARAWSQQQLADALGVSRQTVIAIERERYDPSLPLAFAIAACFDQTIEQIFLP
jgi:putative transcriptional regulator